jgi:hypothetical protein
MLGCAIPSTCCTVCINNAPQGHTWDADALHIGKAVLADTDIGLLTYRIDRAQELAECCGEKGRQSDHR